MVDDCCQACDNEAHDLCEWPEEGICITCRAQRDFASRIEEEEREVRWAEDEAAFREWKKGYRKFCRDEGIPWKEATGPREYQRDRRGRFVSGRP